MVVRNAKTPLQPMKCQKLSVISPTAQLTVKVPLAALTRAMPRKPMRKVLALQSTSVEVVHMQRHTISRSQPSMVVKNARTKMDTRCQSSAVQLLAQWIARVISPHGVHAAPTVALAVSRDSMTSMLRPSMTVVRAHMWTTWHTRHATNIHAQLTALEIGVRGPSVTRSAQIAETVVLLAQSNKHTPSQSRLSMGAQNALTRMVMCRMPLAMSTAVLRIAKALGQNLAIAPPHVAMA